MGLFASVCFITVLGKDGDRTTFEECFIDWDLKRVERKYMNWLTRRHDLKDETRDVEALSKEFGYTFIYGTRSMGDI